MVFMLTGTIKFFNKSKGFGFITADAGKEVFLPSATVVTSGIKKVESGMRVSFQEEADVKGPKAVSLALLDEPWREPAPRPVPVERLAPKAAVSLYYDPASRVLEAVQEVLSAQGIEVQAIDYTAQPPAPEELKKWSLALSGSDFGLVRRSDPMFFALDLDDRFISENDFWLAVSQHPTLINGPVLKAGGKLAIAKSQDDVRRFLGLDATAPAPKELSVRLAALIRGEALPPREEEDEDFEDDLEDVEEYIEEVVAVAAPVTVAPVKIAPVKAAPVTVAPEAAVPVKATPVKVAPVKAAPVKAAPKKVAVKAKAVAKKAPAKPAAKAVAKKAAPAKKPAPKAKAKKR